MASFRDVAKKLNLSLGKLQYFTKSNYNYLKNKKAFTGNNGLNESIIIKEYNALVNIDYKKEYFKTLEKNRILKLQNKKMKKGAKVWGLTYKELINAKSK